MRRFIVLLLGLALLGGCGKRPAPRLEPEPTPTPILPGNSTPTPILPSPGPALQPRYDAALLEAYTQLAAGKYHEALTALEVARAIDPTEQVQREIDRVRLIVAQQNGAVRAIADIRAVLQDGRPEEASRLAGQALALYGSAENADELSHLKRQAEALLAAQTNEQTATRAARLRQEVQTALKPDANNLRAAVVALEQLDAIDTSPEVDQQLTDLRQRLASYDTALQRAQELRAQPQHLDDALEQFQIAAKAWDNFQVQREIEECTRALALRRPRLAVADFEVRGEIQLPDAGKTIAEELLPCFQTHFDLVERGQLVKVLDELKLDAEQAGGNEVARRELARIGKVRYLVVGSVSHLGGLAVNARVIDLETGLIVQTARILADNGADLRQKIPQLGAILLMNDEEKLAFEARQQQAAPVPPVVQPAILPPAPEVPGPGQPLPPPVVTVTVVAPPLGQVNVNDLDRLPPAPAQPAPIVVVPDQEDAVRQQLLFLMVEVGDNHFRRGEFGEAFRCFDLAVALGGPRPELRMRVDRCRPLLPPGFVLLPARPRIGILNFCTHGRVPPGLDCWLADSLACYLPRNLEVVPRGELFWYMRRLGLTMGDVIHNASARRWLARALGVRYFLVGSIRETASYDVTAHLLDAEWGHEVARSHIHVHDIRQLKLCLPDLVRRLFLTPAERARLHAEAEAARLQAAQLERLAAEERLRQARASTNYHLLLMEARRQSAAAKFSLAIEFLLSAQKQRPDSVEVQVLLHQQREQQHRHEQTDRWRANALAQKAAFEEMQRKQVDLARAAEEARQRAEREANLRADAEKRARQAERDRAHAEIQARAQKALDQQRYDQAITLFRDALDLKQNDAALQGLAAARAARDRAQQLAEANEKARKEKALREQREKELALLQAKLEADRQKRERQEQALRDAQQARDRETFAALLQQARETLAKNQVTPALNALQTAKRLIPERANEVEPLWNQALALQNRLALDRLEATKRAELERQLAAEKAAREKAEAEAAVVRQQYAKHLADARRASADGKPELAISKYEDALKLFRTDEATTELRKLKDALAREQTLKLETARKATELKNLRADAMKAFADKDYPKAKTLLTDFTRRSPGDVQALAALGQVEQALARAQKDATREMERRQREAEFRKLVAGGKANLEAKQVAAALVALREAVRLNPEDREASALLQQAEKLQTIATEAEKRRLAQYQKHLADGRAALGLKQFDQAEQSFLEARKANPQDRTIDGFLADVKKGRDDEMARLRAEASKRAEEIKTAQQLAASLQAGRLALAKKDLTEAAKLLDAARKLAPQSPEVKKFQSELLTLQAQARTEAEEQARLAGRIASLVADARKAMAARDLAKASQALREARQLGPRDTTVTQALADLDRLAREPAPNPRQTDYDLAMSAGKSALDRKNYPGAINAYKQALRLMPRDAEATKQLAEAERLLNEANKPAGNGADVQKLLTAAANFERQRKFTEALATYREVLRLTPTDARVKAALQRLESAQAIATNLDAGTTALKAKRWAEAEKAFGAVLKLDPRNAEARSGLQRAREKK